MRGRAQGSGEGEGEGYCTHTAAPRLGSSGTWYQEKEERLIHDTDEDGEETTRWETEWHSDCSCHVLPLPEL